MEGIRPLGVSGGFGIVEPAGEPCEDCGERPGLPHGCLGDGAYHRHGMTHTLEHGLLWLCDECYRHLADVILARQDERRAAWQREHPGEEEPGYIHEVIARVQRMRPSA